MSIILFTTPTCEFSTKARNYLKQKKVCFEEKDLTEDKLARKELIEKSAQIGTPVIQISSKIIIGFDQKKIDSALSKL
jgi:glutaredoxin 3